MPDIHISIDGAVLDSKCKYLQVNRNTAYRMMLQIGMALAMSDGQQEPTSTVEEDDDLLPPMGR